MPSFRRRFPSLAVALCLGLMPLARAAAQVADASPFLPSGGASGPGAADATPLELRGIITTADGTRYCIYDPVKKTGVWLALNERNPAATIKSVDQQHDAVTVQAAGRTMRLELHEAKTVALGSDPGPGGRFGRGRNGADVSAVGSDPAADAAKLKAVADEVARRQQLRNQANAGGDAGAGDGQNADAQPRQRRNRQQQQPSP